jgi:PIN domain nuclease of toxin-antitoxin system
MLLNLDTHIVAYAFTGELSSREDALLKDNDWGISGMVFWELAMLVQRGRVAVDLSDPDVLRRLERLYVWPIDLPVALASNRLDFRSDPADEIIAATSIVHRVPLLTRDRVIRRSKIVPLA